MTQRNIIAALIFFIISLTALGAAFAAVTYYKSQAADADVAVAAAPPGETAFEKQLREQREHQQPQEISWQEQTPKTAKPKDSGLKESHYRLSIKPESLTTPAELQNQIDKLEASLADQRQKCDDRKALIDIRYDQQDITAEQREKDLAKIDFYKEQYTISVLQNIMVLIEKSPCLTAKEKPQHTQDYQSRLTQAQQNSQQARAIYERR